MARNSESRELKGGRERKGKRSRGREEGGREERKRRERGRELGRREGAEIMKYVNYIRQHNY